MGVCWDPPWRQDCGMMAVRLTGMVSSEAAMLGCVAALQPDVGVNACCAQQQAELMQQAEAIRVFRPLRRDDTTTSRDPPAVIVEGLWRRFFEDPTLWWDNRKCKTIPEEPDFKQAATGEGLWVDNRLTPAWVQAKLNFLQEAKAVGSRAQWASGLVGVNSLRQSRWQDQTDRLGNRWNKDQFQHKSPGFRQVAPSIRAGQSECKPSNAVEPKSAERNEFYWRALILQHTKNGQGSQAVRMYEEMRKDGVEASPNTFIALLKACRSLHDLESARKIHAEVVRSGCESDLFVGTMLIDVYIKCRSLVDARHTFEKMPHRDVVSWTAMIVGCTEMGKAEEALQLYTQMQQEGVLPDGRTYVGALKACRALAESEERNEGDGNTVKERCLKTVRSIHSDIVKRKFESGVFVGNMLVDVYAKCGSLVDARRVFENLPNRNVVSWNAMISGCAQMDKGDEALHLYTRMQHEGVVPDGRTFVGALKACSCLAKAGDRNEGDGRTVTRRCLETIRAIHADVRKAKHESNVFVANMLVVVYAKCESLEDARGVFENMPCRDVVSWNSMIFSYAQMDKGEEALQLYTRMQQEGVVLDARTYVGALKACSSLAELADMDEGNGMAVKARCLETVRAIHTNARKGKFESNVFVGSMLVDVYAKCGSLDEARQVFEKIPRRNVVSWNSVILGYAQMDKGEEALQLYSRMQQEGVVPDGRTYLSALKACSMLAESRDRDKGDATTLDERCLETARAIHRNIVKVKLESNVFVDTMLVEVYAKCGSLEEARRVFEKMPRRDVVSWSTMILAYAQMDNGEEALQLYARMQQEGVVPNSQTYVGALNACGSVAALEKGKKIHAQIRKAYREEAIDYFVMSSLIDMYSKCGSMVDAQQLFEAIPRRESVAWNALIAGYAHLGESEPVFGLFTRMKQEGIQPNGITFLGVLTACSHAGLVDRGQEYFNTMRSDYGITPTMNHLTCMVDLLGRAGHLDRAMDVVRAMPFQPNIAVWKSILAACRKWGDVALGRQAFQHAVRLNKDDAAAYVLMANIYSAAHMREEARAMQAMRVASQAWKQPGQSRWTDMSGISHIFSVGDRQHPESQDIHAKVRDLLVEMKKEGYVPHLDSVLRDMPDDAKEEALCGHSERLAIAYALLKTPAGTTIRVVKNLRVCEDCHRATVLISRIEKRTIICRDASRFHVFKEGKCSCGDYW